MSTVDAIAKHIGESVAALLETVKERDRVIDGLIRGKAELMQINACKDRAVERLRKSNQDLVAETNQRALENGALSYIIGYRDNSIKRLKQEVEELRHGNKERP